MNRYSITFSLPIYGEAIVEAETEAEANQKAKNIANFETEEWVDWHIESLYDGNPMEIVDVYLYEKSFDEEPELTDEEWFNKWQEEMYENGYVD